MAIKLMDILASGRFLKNAAFGGAITGGIDVAGQKAKGENFSKKQLLANIAVGGALGGGYGAKKKYDSLKNFQSFQERANKAGSFTLSGLKKAADDKTRKTAGISIDIDDMISRAFKNKKTPFASSAGAKNDFKTGTFASKFERPGATLRSKGKAAGVDWED